jgi:LPXTG-motif cell wall-anchored protein
MRKTLRCIAILAVLLMQLQGVFAISNVDVKAQDETVLLNNDAAKVTVTPVVTATEVEWTIDYAKHAPTDASARAIRFKLASAADGTGTVQRKDGDLQDKVDGDDWYRQPAASTAEETGKLVVSTPRVSGAKLYVWIQLDSTNMGQTSEVLASPEADYKTVEAPVVEETPEEVAPAPEVTETPKEEVQVVAPETEQEEATTTETAPVAEKQEAAVQEEVAKKENKRAVSAATRWTVAAPGAVIGRVRAGSQTTTDPFEYVRNEEVKSQHPNHGTDQHQGTDQEKTSVKNYNYAVADSKTSNLVETPLNGGLNFDNGYTAYREPEENGLVGYTKKTVSPLGDGDFQVQMDMIGQAIHSQQLVDVVFVLDTSGSLSIGNRWQELLDAVDSFADTALAYDGVQIGLVNFSGQGNGNTKGQMTMFKDKGNKEYQTFTTDKNTLMSSSLLSSSGPGSKWTASFFGLDLGLRMLMGSDLGARDNAQKILINITTGTPSLEATENYYNKNGSMGTVNDAMENVPSKANSGQGYIDWDLNRNNGDLHTETTNSTNTVKFINNRLNQAEQANVKSYSIGYHNDDAANSVIVALGKEAYYNTQSSSELQLALEQIINKFTASIQQATVTVPHSQFVEYKEGSLVKEYLTLTGGSLTSGSVDAGDAPQYAQNAKYSATSTGINVSDLTLGGSKTAADGLRLTYIVHLKDEYQIGNFYPTSGTTYLTNNVSEARHLHFAVPSVQMGTHLTNVRVNKDWQDDGNKYQTRDDVTMTLYSRTVGSENDWTEKGKKVFTSGMTSFDFEGMPQYQDGKALEYKVIETVGASGTHVPGYALPEYSGSVSAIPTTEGDVPTITVTNTLNYTNYDFTKTDANGNKLSGAVFEVKRNGVVFEGLSGTETGSFKLNQMPIGEYIFTETTAPDGYDGGASFTVKVEDNGNGGLKLTSEGINNKQVINELKPFELELVKYNRDSEKLPGAEFSIKGMGIDTSGTTNSEGVLEFDSDIQLKPGTYTIKETAAPDGYLKHEGEFTLVIPSEGKEATLEYSKDDLDDSDYSVQKLEYTNSEAKYNKVSISIMDIEEADVPLPLTGGSGLGAFIVIGILLIGTAGYLKLVDWRKKRGGDGNA